jgi:hypothetical protein
MSKSWKKRKKWYDDDWDVSNNQERINKERRLRKDRKETKAYSEEEPEDFDFNPGRRVRYPPRY